MVAQSEECLEKTAATMQLLAEDVDKPRYYLLTGAVMRQPAAQLLSLRPATFRPQHTNKLGTSSVFSQTSHHPNDWEVGTRMGTDTPVYISLPGASLRFAL